MKIRFEKAKMLEKLVRAMGAVSSKNTHPFTEGVLLETAGNRLKLSTYDMEKSVRSSIEAEILIEGGCVINAQRLLSIVRILPENEITMTVDDELLVTIQSGRSSFSLHALAAKDFPQMPVIVGRESFTMEQCVLKKMLAKTAHSIAQIDQRPVLCGAFFKLDLVDIKSSRFVGWWNFRMVLALDDEFWRAFVNTIIFSVVTVFLLMVVTVLMASWLSKNTKIHNLAQTMIFTPHISSMVAVGILWVLMLDPQGIINQFLAIFGIQGPNWLMNARTSLLSVALVTVWKSIGYYCLIIIAGLQSLPKDVYEAARLDKASRWTILRRITLPLMTPTLSFVFIMKFINAFKSFSAIDVMTQGGPQGSSMVLGYWIYNAGRVKFNYGFAMVGAIVLTALVAVFTLLANKGFRKED